MARTTHLLKVLAAGMLATALLAACSSSSSTTTQPATTTTSTSTTTSTTTSAPEGTAVEVKIGETDVQHMYMTLDSESIAAGTVTFTVINEGVKKHEFVVLSTETPTDKLKVEGDEVVEDAYDVTDEIEDIAPGTTEKLTVDLTAGHYALICNLKGHYRMGMWADLTVA